MWKSVTESWEADSDGGVENDKDDMDNFSGFKSGFTGCLWEVELKVDSKQESDNLMRN